MRIAAVPKSRAGRRIVSTSFLKGKEIGRGTHLNDDGSGVVDLILERKSAGEEESDKGNRTFQSGMEKPDDVERGKGAYSALWWGECRLWMRHTVYGLLVMMVLTVVDRTDKNEDVTRDGPAATFGAR